MSEANITSADDFPERDDPAYWLVAFDKAALRGDLDTADIAVGELRRLGVRATYHRRRRQKTR